MLGWESHVWLVFEPCPTLLEVRAPPIVNFLVRHQRWGIGATALSAAVSVIGACNEQYADAVVAEPTASTGGSVSIFPGFTGAGGAGNEFGDPDAGDFEGEDSLCLPCASSVNCGGRGDLCLMIDGEARCGQECEGERDCPDDYDCIEIGDDWQCVPESHSCRESRPSTDEMRAYVRTVLNDLRERRGLPAVDSSQCLDEIGQQAVVELETEGTFKTKFNRECANVVPNCECDWREESQAWVPVDVQTWQEAVRFPFERAAELDPGGSFFRNVVSDDWERVGVGVLLDHDYLRFSLEFAP